MITGLEFAEKLYSACQEEKLYSTGNEELDNLLEKVFCEGYEYAQREFDQKEDKSLSDEDERAIRINSKWKNDGFISDKSRRKDHEERKDILRNHFDKDTEDRANKAIKKRNQKFIATETALGAVLGGTLGAQKHLDDKLIKGLTVKKDIRKSAAKNIGIGALLGAGATAGLSYGIAKATDKWHKEHLDTKKVDVSKRKTDERQADLLDVADGKMSRAEFKKKWYK